MNSLLKFFKESYKTKAFKAAVLISLVSALLLYFLVYQSYKIYYFNEENQLAKYLDNVEDNIDKLDDNSELALLSLSYAVNSSGEVTGFDSLASKVIRKLPAAFGVQLVTAGEITHIYPYKDHESALGFNILENDSTRIDAEQAIKNKSVYFAGPLMLRQGTFGIVGRMPIYRQDKFWGFSAVLYKFKDFLDFVKLTNDLNSGISYEFSIVNPETGEEEYLIQNNASHFIQLRKKIKGSNWIIYVQKDYSSWYVFLFIFISLGGIFFIISQAVAIYKIVNQPEKLNRIIALKTCQLKEEKANYKAIINSIPDLIFITTAKGIFTDYYAKDTSKLLDKSGSFVGKSVHEVFSTELGIEIMANITLIHKRLETVKKHSYRLTINNEIYHFEARYVKYPKDKVLILVRDVTSEHESLSLLRKSEFKYKKLVEQATDGIFNCALNGDLKEVNRQLCLMTGYEESAIKALNINDILQITSADDNAVNLIDTLLDNNKIITECHLLTKEGTRLPVEINCTLNQQNLIQGIIRDVSKRYEYIRSIEKQNNRLREIARIQSHEVRAPLARIMGIVEYFNRNEVRDEKNELRLMQQIYESAVELDNKIKQVVINTDLKSH